MQKEQLVDFFSNEKSNPCAKSLLLSVLSVFGKFCCKLDDILFKSRIDGKNMKKKLILNQKRRQITPIVESKKFLHLIFVRLII